MLKSLIENLIRAGALDEMEERRVLLRDLGAMEEPHEGFDLPIPVVNFELPALEGLPQAVWEYE